MLTKKLTYNGRSFTAHQPIAAQKETFISKHVELEQRMMAGSGGVSVEWLGQNGR